jgi:hypothetical protein
MYDGMRVDEIQRIYDGGWNPSAASDDGKSEKVRHWMNLERCVHWLHWLHLEPTSEVEVPDTHVLLLVRWIGGERVHGDTCEI